MTSPRCVFPHLTVLFEQKEAHPREVQLLHYEDWKGDIAGSVQDLVQLVDIVLSTTPPPGQDSPPVVVQCRWVGKPMLALRSYSKVSPAYMKHTNTMFERRLMSYRLWRFQV